MWVWNKHIYIFLFGSASFIIQWQCRWKCTCFNSTSSNKMLCYIQGRHTESNIRSQCYLTDITYMALIGYALSGFLQSLIKNGYISSCFIFNGRIPVLNCDIRERRRRDIHLIIYVSGSNISLDIMYVLSLVVFSIVHFHLVT